MVAWLGINGSWLHLFHFLVPFLTWFHYLFHFVPFPTDPVSNAFLVCTGKNILKVTGVFDQDVQLTVRMQTLKYSSTKLTLHASPT